MKETNEIFFSIIIAAYNVETYLSEAIDSVLDQKFDLTKIQIILVDDGSDDNTGKICDYYEKKYPKTITVIHKKNAGVAAARNDGLKKAQGVYVNFLDGDDKFSSDLLLKVKKFLDKNESKTNVVSVPLFFFGAKDGEHPLNFKFNSGSRVIDLNKEPEIKQLHISSSFIKKSSIGKITFDTNLKYAEDAKFLQELFFSKPYLGLVSDTKYWYRRRSDESSAIQKSFNSKFWYQDYLDNFQKEIVNLSISKFGYIPKYVQHVLAYDLQWRINQKTIPSSIMNNKEKIEYKRTLFSLFDAIDDDVIMAQNDISAEQKIMILTKKHKKLPEQKKINNHISFVYPNGTICMDASLLMITIDFLKIVGKYLIIEGWLPHSKFLEEDFSEIYIRTNNSCYVPIFDTRSMQVEECSVEEIIFHKINFKFKIPLDDFRNLDSVKLDFMRKTNFNDVKIFVVFWERFAPMSGILLKSYFKTKNWTFYHEKQSIFLKRNTSRFLFELKLLFELLKKREKNAFFARILFFILKNFKKKPIWLISDRIVKANDNGEAFFEYLNKQKDLKTKIRYYFVISKTSDDYKRLKKLGKVVDSFSWKHKILYLLCDFNISSSADNSIVQPFQDHSFCYCDIICKIKFIFLQHGVIKDDLSGWLSKYNQNFSGFITSSKYEFDSIINTKSYYYDDNIVWVTGLPRFDYLTDSSKNEITLAPTWRRWLLDKLDEKTGIWSLKDDFRKSDYYKFYNELLNDTRLLRALEKNNYKLNFLLHPNLMPYINLFKQNRNVVFCSFNTVYRDIYSKSKLIITDYSSTVFDFAYIKKPVLYCQFDKSRFTNNEHSYRPGYFDYEKDGFGEVEYTLNSTINRIIEYLENDCRMKDKYIERVENFFAFHDCKNCERVYKKIMELQESSSN